MTRTKIHTPWHIHNMSLDAFQSKLKQNITLNHKNLLAEKQGTKVLGILAIKLQHESKNSSHPTCIIILQHI